MILNAGIPQSRCLADQTKLIIMSESNKKRVQGTSLCPPQFLVLKWSHITSAHQRLFILNPLIKDSNQDAKFTNALRFHCLSGTVYLSEGKGNRNLNRNRNGDRSGCCEGVEWNGMECPPQVPPYEPSKNHVEITLPKGHEIDPGPKPENPEE